MVVLNLQAAAIHQASALGTVVHPLFDRICQHSSSPTEAGHFFSFLLWPNVEQRSGCELLHLPYLKSTALAMERATGRSGKCHENSLSSFRIVIIQFEQSNACSLPRVTHPECACEAIQQCTCRDCLVVTAITDCQRDTYLSVFPATKSSVVLCWTERRSLITSMHLACLYVSMLPR